MYFVKAPELLKKLYGSGLLWRIESKDSVYLTFDDGPHQDATRFVLEQLSLHNAQGTFFCIGKNVAAEPDLFTQILSSGHRVGNHSFNHLNGWKHSCAQYLENVRLAQELISSNLFRPPYGRICKKQASEIKKLGFSIVMWDVLSGDFDNNISNEQCWQNIAKNLQPGSIVVFHDSAKALEKLRYVLPKTLSLCQEKGWAMKALPVQTEGQHITC